MKRCHSVNYSALLGGKGESNALCRALHSYVGARNLTDLLHLKVQMLALLSNVRKSLKIEFVFSLWNL